MMPVSNSSSLSGMKDLKLHAPFYSVKIIIASVVHLRDHLRSQHGNLTMPYSAFLPCAW